MADRSGIFAGDNPFVLAQTWLEEAESAEPNDPNAVALATVDPEGLPNVRMVLLKLIEDNAFLFFTNYGSAKGREIDASGKAALVAHWKSLRRQIRARGLVEREEMLMADAYFDSRSRESRIGALASRQSQPLASRAALMSKYNELSVQMDGEEPERPTFWGGFRLRPLEIEFWSERRDRLHDRFRWSRTSPEESNWSVERLYP